MAVAPASMADKIIVLDDDGEEIPEPLRTTPSRSSKQNVKVSSLKAQQSAPTHITQSPFASAKKEADVLQAENERLFAEFVEHCTAQTKDCPEVITFLQAKHAKASPSFLCSVEFRNTLGRCLTRAQSHRSKTFVYINELCTVLRQHSIKKRQTLTKAETSTSALVQGSSDQNKTKNTAKAGDSNSKNTAEEDEQPSTSGIKDESDPEKKATRKSRKQIAYLENLLKVYNEEIRHLQETDLSLDDLGAEDSLYIQEHRLKRKMMKIYEKLCEIKGCNTTTGRVLEQRIMYSGSRYPEINKKVERFVNSPEAQMNPPDYPDILQLVLRANERYNLCLPRKQLNKIAKEAFEEVAGSIQERRQLDLVYNFGSHLTDRYKPACDPALADPSLMQKLRANRELALDRLKGVITEYAVKQEETEEQERLKRLEKDKTKKEGNATKKGKVGEANGNEENEEEEVDQEEEEEDEEDEDDDQSSDPDIEEEIKASTQQDGPEGVSEEEESNEAEQAGDDADDDQLPPSVSVSEKEEAETSDLSPMSQQSQSLLTPLSSASSPRDSPSQSEPTDRNDPKPLSNGPPSESNQLSVVLVTTKTTKDNADVSSAENGVCPSACETQTSSGTSPPNTPRMTRGQKRRREEETSVKPVHTITRDGDADIPLDMGVFNCDSPPRVTQADNIVSSSQSTPPPKKNKVNVATQCDPQEVIVLSDSE